ncbi:hypothetical protein VSR68_05925 [Paraburkholderia phymatum]|uniref:hypothetical protein n=1 Tax=Paraburkholderia phymatum TaxID=148447 RepID=UPI0031753E63
MTIPVALGKILKLPVIAAPMFLVSGPELVMATCRSGAIGTFPALNQRTTEGYAQWLDTIKTGLGPNDAAFGVNLIVHKTPAVSSLSVYSTLARMSLSRASGPADMDWRLTNSPPVDVITRMAVAILKAAVEAALGRMAGVGRKYSVTATIPDIRTDDGARGGNALMTCLTVVDAPTAAMADQLPDATLPSPARGAPKTFAAIRRGLSR